MTLQTTLFKGSFYLISFCHSNQTHPKCCSGVGGKRPPKEGAIRGATTAGACRLVAYFCDFDAPVAAQLHHFGIPQCDIARLELLSSTTRHISTIFM
jgi:hypothetical protein